MGTAIQRVIRAAAASSLRTAAAGAAALALCACNGSPWARYSEIADMTLDVVYADGTGATWIGGRAGTVLRYEHGGFQDVDTGSLRSVRAIHGAGPGDVWLAGDDGLLLHWEGETLVEHASPTEDDIEALWVFSPDDILVVTTTREYRGSPGAWRDLDLDGTFDLVWAFGPDDVWLIQSLGDFAHFDGAGWESVDPGLPGVPLWYDVTGRDGELWLVGAFAGNDADWVLHYADAAWDVERIDRVGDVHSSAGIEVTGEGALYRVGSFGFTATRVEGTWTTLAGAGEYDMLNDVAATDTELIAVGEHGVIWTMPL